MEAERVTTWHRLGTQVPLWAGTLSFLFTDAEGSTELFDAEPTLARRAGPTPPTRSCATS